MSHSQNAMAVSAPAAKAADVVDSRQQDVNACLTEARNQLAQKDFRSVITTCKKALENSPHDSNLRDLLSEAYYNLGLAEEWNTVDYMREAVMLKPDYYAPAYYYLGLHYFTDDYYGLAARYIDRALRVKSNLELKFDKRIEAYRLLGEINEERLHKYHDAIKSYNAALSLMPDNDEAKAIRQERKRALLSAIQSPSSLFLESLLQQDSNEMFADIEKEKISRDRFFAKINKLADVKLKQKLLCHMLLKDTFLGKLFLNYDLKKICKALEGTISDAKKTLELSNETREMLRKDENLKATLLGSSEFYKTYKIIFTWTLGLGIKAPSAGDAKVLPPAGARVYPVLEKNEDDWVIDACTQKIEKNKDAKEGVDDAKAYADRGAAYCRKGDYARAHVDINHAIKLNPILGIAFFHLGDVHRCQKQLDLAIQNYSNAIRLNPELAEAHCHLGHVLCEQGSFDLAIINYRKAMSLSSCFDREIIQNLTDVINSGRATAEIYHLRGDCYQRARRFDLAIQDYTQASANKERKAVLLLALKDPSREFLELLLLPAYSDMFNDIASEAIDKDNVFAAISKLQDKQLKQNLLCQILLKETFLGKLFHKKRLFERDFSTKAADALVVFVDDAKEGLSLGRGTIQALVRELPTTCPALEKICKHVASKCLAEGHKHIQENNLELAFEDYHHAAKLDSTLVTTVQHHCKNAFLVAQENPSEAFFKLLLKPYVWKMLVDLDVQHEVNKDKLLQAIKVLKDKNLKQAVLRQALLPRTFFNNIFADDQAEIAELFLAEVGLERALADDAIRAVFLTGGPQATLVQQSSTDVDNVPITEPKNFQKLFLLAALNNHPKMFFNLMLRPIYQDSLTSRDINTDQLLQVLKVLSDKDLQLRVLLHALLPKTFFGRIFAEQREEIANLFVAKIHTESTLSDAEINAVMFANLQDKLAQQNRALYVKQQSAWGLTRLEGQSFAEPERVVSPKASSALTCQALRVSPAAVIHNREPEIRPGCDGSQPAAASIVTRASSYENPRRRVISC